MTNGIYAGLEKIECSQVVLIVIYDLSVHLASNYGAKYVGMAVNLLKQLCGIERH
jgi:hypothetical protein